MRSWNTSAKRCVGKTPICFDCNAERHYCRVKQSGQLVGLISQMSWVQIPPLQPWWRVIIGSRAVLKTVDEKSFGGSSPSATAIKTNKGSGLEGMKAL